MTASAIVRLRTPIHRSFRLIAALLGCTAALWAACWLTRPRLAPHPLPYTPQQIARAVAARHVTFDPAHTPSLYRSGIVRPTGESPILRSLEDAGDLPPLAQRMPAEPVVIEGEGGIGKYGGTWTRLAPSADDTYIVSGRLSGAFLVRWSPLGYPIEPHIAKSVTPSADRRVWTIAMRPGLKWSDGQPYTADDIMYWWEHEATDPAISTRPPDWMYINDALGRVEKIDDYHVRFSFDHPYALFAEMLTQVAELTNTPAHYLRRYQPTIGDQDLIKRTQEAYELPSPRSVYDYMKATNNSECPRLWPWIYRKYASGPRQVFVRNPYYYVVDPKGNQLPYVDRLQFSVIDPQVLPISAADGAASMQERTITYSDFTELMSRRAAAGTRVLQWYSSTRSQYVINPDLNRHVDAGDPSSAWKAKLLSDARFRQALSLAIDREAIIRAEYNGQGVPSQVEPGPLSPFHSETLANAFIAHDPARSNAMLDALKLNQRDSEGFRTFPDGTRMTFFFDFTPFTGIGPAQFIADDWAAVGVRIVVRERSRPLFMIEKDGGVFDFDVWTSESDYMPLLSPRELVAVTTEAYYAPGWARWFMRGGYFGDPAAGERGCIPVPKSSPMYQAMGLYVQALQTPNLPQQQKLVSRMEDIAAENLWVIGISTSPPNLVVVQDDFRNVPTIAMVGALFNSPANTGIETYFYDHPHDSPGAIAETRDAILHPTLRPGGQGASAGGVSRLSVILRVLPALLFLAAIGFLAFHYPYVGRRLLIMVPTLLVISIIVFIIIQLPPGDYLTTRIATLEENGDPQAQRQIDELRTQFHFEDSAWQKYARWMGVEWFAGFHPEDAGLLQGNLGRSMETGQPVNQMIGERLMFTVLLSLGTILFTWIVAIPIGIYSAVRQYSWGDYVLTLIGFIGMCVPSFLLALILMAVSGVSGLFSPEFAVQPEWNWPKVADLLRHVWIPIVVLGVGGTAGMIRIMRANLLDELRRPYVTTAVAKGVRPMRVLIKYPVRMSLNPFVSGIGGLFPALISGGAIVSIVLSLPTIGPLMLSALLDQDMYLAGSLLMVLNALSVLGTLVSDLMLLWLDPRIRLGGGAR